MKWTKQNRYVNNTIYQGYRFSLMYHYPTGEYDLMHYKLTNLDNTMYLTIGYLDTLTDAKKQAEKIIYNLTERKVK
tara:strand:+ start:292 stop:519 length:228 start_codon:yes stop_codon:yes gene_type:complete